jgi:prephenate dehydratase
MQLPKEEPSSSTEHHQFTSNDRTSIIFTLKHQIGALARALQVFQELGINVLHIELHADGHESENEMVKKN